MSETAPERVLLVYKHYAPDTGGIETVVKQYARWYRALGWEVRILCCAVSGLSTRHETVDGIRVVRCGTWGIMKSVPISPAFFWHYFRQSHWADLVHVNLQFPWASIGYWLFGGFRRCKWLVSYHMDVHRQRLLKNITYPFDKLLLRNADMVVTSSPALRDHSEVLSDVGREISVLPFSLEEEALQAEWEHQEQEAEHEPYANLAPGYFVFFGRLVEYKGTRPLASAMRRLAVERPDIRFVVFGNGPDKAEFASLAEGYPEQVTMIPGFVSESLKYRLISRSSALLFPSVYPSEAFGIAQLEAMAHGKPIINCWLNSGVNWVAPDEECAVTIPPHDVDALVGAICKLHDDPQRRNELGRAARERFVRVFSESVVAERFKRLVRSLVRAG